jgi:hypothetical protein
MHITLKNSFCPHDQPQNAMDGVLGVSNAGRYQTTIKHEGLPPVTKQG